MASHKCIQYNILFPSCYNLAIRPKRLKRVSAFKEKFRFTVLHCIGADLRNVLCWHLHCILLRYSAACFMGTDCSFSLTTIIKEHIFLP